uniref:Uncharacterized protein n=1 Tax=Moniliophthora roreri TaxID=221103 RepID=A0A0W0FXX5_MONRR
MFFVFLNTLK